MSVFDKDIVEKETLTERVLKVALELWEDNHKSPFNPIRVSTPLDYLNKLQHPRSYFERTALIDYVFTALDISKDNGELLKLNYICNETGEPYEINRWSPDWTYSFSIDKE